jgi:transposase
MKRCLSEMGAHDGPKYALWRIEESFRINKHTLRMRPIYHFKPERIQAHIALCYLSFALLRQLVYRVTLAQTPMSVPEVLDALTSVQATIFVHKRTKDKYRVPSAMSQAARKIYRALGITRPPSSALCPRIFALSG